VTEIERMVAEHACIKLQMQYGVFADRGDVEGFVGLFAPDASITVPEHPPFAGHAAIRASIQGLANLGVTMRHVIINSVIDVRDAETADGICYLLAFNSAGPPDAAGCPPSEPPATVGEYADTFRRTDIGWKFTSRVLTRVFRRDDDAVQAAARAAASRN
jgi:hypothetical protein